MPSSSAVAVLPDWQAADFLSYTSPLEPLFPVRVPLVKREWIGWMSEWSHSEQPGGKHGLAKGKVLVLWGWSGSSPSLFLSTLHGWESTSTCMNAHYKVGHFLMANQVSWSPPEKNSNWSRQMATLYWVQFYSSILPVKRHFFEGRNSYMRKLKIALEK